VIGRCLPPNTVPLTGGPPPPFRPPVLDASPNKQRSPQLLDPRGSVLCRKKLPRRFMASGTSPIPDRKCGQRQKRTKTEHGDSERERRVKRRGISYCGGGPCRTFQKLRAAEVRRLIDFPPVRCLRAVSC
jgi:hypothetical protein